MKGEVALTDTEMYFKTSNCRVILAIMNMSAELNINSRSS